MRILDAHGIEYKTIIYDRKDGKIDGVSVAEKIGEEPKKVFKTLVAQGSSGELYVFIIPVAEELDLKKAAKAASEKKVEMISVKEITKYTGYIRGGCSPIGMKKNYPTFIDKSSLNLDTIIISGGKIGVQIEILLKDLGKIIDVETFKLVKE